MTSQKASRQIRMIFLSLLGLCLFILGGLAAVYLSRASASGSNDEIVQITPFSPRPVEFQAPELSLLDVNGGLNHLSDFKGKVVLVNNWAIWCAPCRAELPELEAYYKAHQNEAFTLIGIESGSEKIDVTNHIGMYHLTYPIWLDPNLEAVRAFHNSGLPNSYVIDENGIVRLAWSGAVTRQMLEDYVTPIIKGK